MRETNMMKTFAAAVVVAFLGGCAGGPPPLPDPQDAYVEVVAKPAPEHFGQYVIPNSQVLVSMFDLGALAGHEGAFMVRADHVIVDHLRAADIVHLRSESAALITLIPKVRLLRHGDIASVACVLEAEYSAGGMADSFVHRVYSYPVSESRRLVGNGDGWSDNEGAKFHAFVRSAFGKLADDFTADWRRQAAQRGGRSG
jgi:hypothetical protein